MRAGHPPFDRYCPRHCCPGRAALVAKVFPPAPGIGLCFRHVGQSGPHPMRLALSCGMEKGISARPSGLQPSQWLAGLTAGENLFAILLRVFFDFFDALGAEDILKH